MKKSELRQIIREEISSIESRERLDEGIFDRIMLSIFGKLADRRGKKIRKMLERDPEMLKAKKQIDDATERMRLKAKEIEKSTGIKLKVV